MVSPSRLVYNSLQSLMAKGVIIVQSALELLVSPYPELSHVFGFKKKKKNSPLRSDTNPKTGVQDCCTGKKLFKTDAVATKEGACCDKEQIYSFDSASGKGSCCASGETFTGGKCQVPKKDPPPATVPDVPAKDPCNKCSSNFVCACEGTLGIKYGKCYTMTDVNGLQLNRDVAGTYQSGGDIGNLIFKVNIPSSAGKCFHSTWD